MSFEAKYHGSCGNCGEKIAPGQQVKYTDGRYNSNGVLVHDDCEEATPPEKKAGEICPECFMEKSVSGACGCV